MPMPMGPRAFALGWSPIVIDYARTTLLGRTRVQPVHRILCTVHGLCFQRRLWASQELGPWLYGAAGECRPLQYWSMRLSTVNGQLGHGHGRKRTDHCCDVIGCFVWVAFQIWCNIVVQRMPAF